MFLVQNEFHNMYQFGWHFLITTNMLGKKWIGDLKFQIGFDQLRSHFSPNRIDQLEILT